MADRYLSSVLFNAYRQNGTRPVAFVDETYSVDPAHDLMFYVMTAVVVEHQEMDGLRAGLVRRAGSSFWHSSDALRTCEGRERMHELLSYLGADDGKELCIISHRVGVDPGDSNGETARSECLTALLAELARGDFGGGPLRLVVLERRRENAEAAADRATKAAAVKRGLVPASMRFLQISPGVEQLLWLPDLVCSAYRQRLVSGNGEYFNPVERITTLVWT